MPLLCFMICVGFAVACTASKLDEARRSINRVNNLSTFLTNRARGLRMLQQWHAIKVGKTLTKKT